LIRPKEIFILEGIRSETPGEGWGGRGHRIEPIGADTVSSVPVSVDVEAEQPDMESTLHTSSDYPAQPRVIRDATPTTLRSLL